VTSRLGRAKPQANGGQREKRGDGRSKKGTNGQGTERETERGGYRDTQTCAEQRPGWGNRKKMPTEKNRRTETTHKKEGGEKRAGQVIRAGKERDSWGAFSTVRPPSKEGKKSLQRIKHKARHTT